MHLFLVTTVLCALAAGPAAHADATGVVSYKGILRFQAMEEGKIYRGPEVSKQEFDEIMTEFNIKTVINLQNYRFQLKRDIRNVTAYEKENPDHRPVTHVNAPWTALPIPPHQPDVFKALDDMGNPSLQPVYVHCSFGRERTGLVAALYRMYYQGWSKEAAWKEWTTLFGYGNSAFARALFHGVTKFFDDHTDPLGYWTRHPVLMKTLGAPPEKVCESYSDDREMDPRKAGGKVVFCRAGDSMIAAATLMQAQVQGGHTDAEKALKGGLESVGCPRDEDEMTSPCELYGAEEKHLKGVASGDELRVCRFGDGSAVEAAALQTRNQPGKNVDLVRVMSAIKASLPPESEIIK